MTTRCASLVTIARQICLLTCVSALVAYGSLARAQEPSEQHWVGTWATAGVAQPVTGPLSSLAGPPPAFVNQTIRQVVRVSLGGQRIRVTLSNTFGVLPLDIGSARVSRLTAGAGIESGSTQRVTFGGREATTIPAGAIVVSDPIAIEVPALSDLVIDLYLPGDTTALGSPLTIHGGSNQTGYVSELGDHTGAIDLPVQSTATTWFFLSSVDVLAPTDVGAVVLFGDSITDGNGSTDDANNRWPDYFARRLSEAEIPMGVLNLGISGNRVLSDGLGVSALARFDRDVLAQSGVTHVVVLEGINDIGLALNELGLPRSDTRPTADDIIFGHEQILARAKSHGLTVYGATFLPFAATSLAIVPNYWSPEGEQTRQSLNTWIRTSGAYDGVIDFETAVHDPAAPTKIRAQYDSGDGLHPSDAGYEAMAEAIDLDLFRASETMASAH